MKILAVLALLISLSAAYQDFSLTFTANATQTPYVTSSSTGSCTVTVKWDTASMTLSGDISCTGLSSNVTGVHFHDCTKDYSIMNSDCNLLAGVSISVPTDPSMFPYLYSVILPDLLAMDSICNDQTYVNIHTKNYAGGEVRANVVSMRSVCNIPTYKADGSITSYGTDPTSGVLVQDFCGTFTSYAASGPGVCIAQVCWDSAADTLTVSGICSDLPSDISEIYATYPDDYSSSFIYFTSTDLPMGCPFTYREISIDEEQMAYLLSKKSQLNFDLFSTGGVQVNVTSSSAFPASKAKCVPFTGDLPTDLLKCYYSSSITAKYSDSDCYFKTDLCSVDSTDTDRNCLTYSSCYTCVCDAVAADLPAGGRACCNTNNCNDDLDDIGCGGSTGAGFMISGGLLATLFVALISIWYN
jgi:hypothetical protein